jgi:molybdenum-dependent DNA-binding transcriptional regulator ModE
MNAAQFDALSELLRLRAGPAQVATRLVLVNGMPVPDAAREVGMDYRAAFQAVARAKRGLELARLAAGPV